MLLLMNPAVSSCIRFTNRVVVDFKISDVQIYVLKSDGAAIGAGFGRIFAALK